MTADEPETEPVADVRDAPDASRYEASVDGQLAGFAAYRRNAERIVFTHTEVDDAYAGHGVGGQLARDALDDARARGLRVVPECPFIARWIDEHPDYRELVAEA